MTDDTGGWSLTDGFSPEGTLCLQADEGNFDVAYNGNPLNPAQLRALAARCIEAASELEAKSDD
ncbi:hypothetical protein ACIO1C_29505 [Streptomyces sp. NPDC087420]|uniref:hypothetical protein n=1 Tax=Streptomyces sp. NPDC087420 TaxID=3365785 RepID=UPI003833117B